MARPRLSPGQVSPADPLGFGQRWTVARKREVVLRLLRGEPMELMSRQFGVEIFRLEQWREKAIAGIEAALKDRKGDPVKAELDTAMKRIGELTMQVELLEAKRETSRPFGAAEVAAMSAATSPGTGLAYGAARVCAAWDFARSSFYALKSRQHATAERRPAKRRGPKPSISDQALLTWPSRPTWRHPPGRARDTARSGLGFGSVVASGLPASGCSG